MRFNGATHMGQANGPYRPSAGLWQRLVETDDLVINSWIGPPTADYVQFSIYKKET